MVKNKGGSKHKRAKKNSALQTEKIVMCEDDALEHYAYVKSTYGNGQFGVLLVCTDGNQMLGVSTKEYRGRIAGRMRKQKYRNFVRVGGLVLISKRDFQTNDDKVDIIHVYKDDAVRKLIKMGEVPSVDNLNGANGVELTDAVIFADDADADDENGGGVLFGDEDGDEDEDEAGGKGTTTTPASVGKGTGHGGGRSNNSDWGIDVDDI